MVGQAGQAPRREAVVPSVLTKQTEEDAPERGFLSSVPVLLVLLIPLMLISYLGRVGAPDLAAPARSAADLRTVPDPVDGFRVADGMRLRAYAERDPTLLRLGFTPDGRAGGKVEADLESLRRAGIEDRTTFETIDLDLLGAGDVTARVRQKVVVTPAFFDGTGRDVTFGGAQLQVIVWNLRLRGDDWLIHSGRVIWARDADG